jgi:predicted TIM-barrel enzyme
MDANTKSNYERVLQAQVEDCGKVRKIIVREVEQIQMQPGDGRAQQLLALTNAFETICDVEQSVQKQI